jgi:hypothetical protein
LLFDGLKGLSVKGLQDQGWYPKIRQSMRLARLLSTNGRIPQVLVAFIVLKEELDQIDAGIFQKPGRIFKVGVNANAWWVFGLW